MARERFSGALLPAPEQINEILKKLFINWFQFDCSEADEGHYYIVIVWARDRMHSEDSEDLPKDVH